MCVCSVARLCLTLCDPIDCSLSSSSAVEYFRQEYWSGFPFPPPGDLPNPGTEPKALSSALVGRFFPTAPPGRPNKEMQKRKMSAGCARVWAQHECLRWERAGIHKEQSTAKCSRMVCLHEWRSVGPPFVPVLLIAAFVLQGRIE